MQRLLILIDYIMLDKVDKVQCRKVLKLLSFPDLISLKDTVTNHLIGIQDSKEAVNAILDYSESPSELLGRKKVGRDLIFQYLHNEKQRVDPKGDKKYLIVCAVNYINSLKENASHFKTASHTFSKSNLETSSSSVGSQDVNSTATDCDQQISNEFVNWFYPMLNSLHGPPFTSVVPWSAEHFWHDCRLRCHNSLEQDSQNDRFETFEGAHNTHHRLSSFIVNNHLIFNVNNTSVGHRGRINPHGLAKVIACGTLHKVSFNAQSQPCAVFEQLFGLIRDPMDENRWKIKFTDLRLSTFFGDTVPSLSESTLLQIEQD